MELFLYTITYVILPLLFSHSLHHTTLSVCVDSGSESIFPVLLFTK